MCAFTPVPCGHGLIDFEPEEEARALETYAIWARLFELLPHYSWIIDRFHLSTIAYQASQGRTYDFGWLEQRLVPLGFHIVLCTRRAGTWSAARDTRLRISGNPSQYDDLDIFRREQEIFRSLAAQSRLPVLELDTGDGDLAAACDQIADWLAETRWPLVPLTGLTPQGHPASVWATPGDLQSRSRLSETP